VSVALLLLLLLAVEVCAFGAQDAAARALSLKVGGWGLKGGGGQVQARWMTTSRTGFLGGLEMRWGKGITAEGFGCCCLRRRRGRQLN
jgi:opacity protein-like surface antigen